MFASLCQVSIVILVELPDCSGSHHHKWEVRFPDRFLPLTRSRSDWVIGWSCQERWYLLVVEVAENDDFSVSYHFWAEPVVFEHLGEEGQEAFDRSGLFEGLYRTCPGRYP